MIETVTPIVGFTIGMLVGHYFHKHKLNKMIEEERIAHVVNEELLYHTIIQLYNLYGAEVTVNLIDNSIKIMVNNGEITIDTDSKLIAEEIIKSIFYEDGENNGQSD